MKCHNILHVIKTKGLIYDGRLLKTIKSLNHFGYKSSILILEDNNKNSSYYNVEILCKVRTISLITRTAFGKGRGLLLKVPEYTFKTFFRMFSKEYDTIWLHENQNYGNLFLISFLRKILGFRKNVIWDQHELPHEIFFRYKIARLILNFLLQVPNLIIFSNEERKRLVMENFVVPYNTKYFVLNNFPLQAFIDNENAVIPQELKNWLEGKPYFIWQGLADESRNFIYTFKAFMQFKEKFKLVILGSIPNSTMEYIIQTIGPNYKNYVYHRFVRQNKIINYLDSAFLSFVFYDDKSLNNKFCESNRLYQTICREVPVICGKNPSIITEVEKYNCCYILDDYGDNVNSLIKAIKEVQLYYDNYKENMRKCKYKFVWNTQIAGLIKILS